MSDIDALGVAIFAFMGFFWIGVGVAEFFLFTSWLVKGITCGTMLVGVLCVVQSVRIAVGGKKW